MTLPRIQHRINTKQLFHDFWSYIRRENQRNHDRCLEFNDLPYIHVFLLLVVPRTHVTSPLVARFNTALYGASLASAVDPAETMGNCDFAAWFVSAFRSTTMRPA